MAMIY